MSQAIFTVLAFVALLALLPLGVKWFMQRRLGPAGAESDVRLMNFARKQGVGDRLEITGYLPDDEFRRRLVTA